ncbi:MAG TPA: hypothetical protein VGH79_03760 [Gaiellaceae bacterium]|jgi:hypothetical protein
MDHDHAPVGLLISALGAAVLAISVFQPWYGVSITATGATTAQQQLAAVAERYGNATLQAQAHTVGAQFESLTGRQLFTVSAHQTMGHVSTILLVLAGIALLASLLRLANLRGLLYATGSQIALLGGMAALVVLFRMLLRPAAATSSISFSLSWGIVLALGSASAIAVGGLIAGSDRTIHRAGTRRGPGAPPLMAPPSRAEIAREALSPPANRRR